LEKVVKWSLVWNFPKSQNLVDFVVKYPIKLENKFLATFFKVYRYTGGYFDMFDKPNEFHSCHTQYKNLGQMHDLFVVLLSGLVVGELNEIIYLYGVLWVDTFKFGRIYTIVKEADTKIFFVQSIIAPNLLSINILQNVTTQPTLKLWSCSLNLLNHGMDLSGLMLLISCEKREVLENLLM